MRVGHAVGGWVRALGTHILDDNHAVNAAGGGGIATQPGRYDDAQQLTCYFSIMYVALQQLSVTVLASAINDRDMSSTLSLANIRSSLIRQEDTIIFSFIERAQFARNLPVYTADAIPVPGAAAGLAPRDAHAAAASHHIRLVPRMRMGGGHVGGGGACLVCKPFHVPLHAHTPCGTSRSGTLCAKHKNVGRCRK